MPHGQNPIGCADFRWWAQAEQSEMGHRDSLAMSARLRLPKTDIHRDGGMSQRCQERSVRTNDHGLPLSISITSLSRFSARVSRLDNLV